MRLKKHPPAQHSGIGVLVIQVQIYYGCSRKETGNAKIAVTSQVHLLQPAVIVERRKKYVSCVWRMLYNPVTFRYKTHHIISYHGKIPIHTRNQKQLSVDRGTSNRPEKLKFR